SGASQVEREGLDEVLLAQAIRTPDGARALRAVDLLVATGAALAPHVKTLLTHPDERVRERGVKVALDVGATNAVKELEALVTGGPRRPRGAAVRALPPLGPARGR